ncbi:hypothetical protein ACTHSJ_25575 [Paenibacillus cellulositrophicus]|uniref:hypothetical protein n=1 Tax=Paenibacillus cellulositrophicus TaxID=562959 RepID=UPI003F7E6B80
MNSKEILKYKQNMIDMEFKYQLGESAACFSRDFTGGNNSNYESCVGSVAAASAVVYVYARIGASPGRVATPCGER